MWNAKDDSALKIILKASGIYLPLQCLQVSPGQNLFEKYLPMYPPTYRESYHYGPQIVRVVKVKNIF